MTETLTALARSAALSGRRGIVPRPGGERNFVQDRDAALCEGANAKVCASSPQPMEDLKGPAAMFSTIALREATATRAFHIFAGKAVRFGQGRGRNVMRYRRVPNLWRASMRHHRRCEPPVCLDRSAA